MGTARRQFTDEFKREAVGLSGNLYKLWNRPADVLPIVAKEL
jgi:hypothetical protein